MNTIETITLSAWLLLIGILAGFLANILVSRGSYKTKWMFLFYGIGLVTFCLSVWTIRAGGDPYVTYPGISISAAYFPTLYFMTRRKDRFSTHELNPMIIKFTSDADDELLRLFFGDINCFGDTPSTIEQHPQYQQLKQLQFKRVLILCERPQKTDQKVRYGKLLTDFQDVRIKHYNTTTARDIGVRGRIKKVGPANVDHIQLYRGARHDGNKCWAAVERDMNHSDCLLYVKLWEMLWDNADPSADSEVREWRKLYRP
jgi:hypothetical protein